MHAIRTPVIAKITKDKEAAVPIAVLSTPLVLSFLMMAPISQTTKPRAAKAATASTSPLDAVFILLPNTPSIVNTPVNASNI